ncbi:MAG: S8 family serine peptidase [Proteobacteria bacterium]|nr:S8 family serine peptidase [Pseudomonadota bacterium]
MRVRSVLTASAALAVLLGGSYAQAAVKTETTLDQVTFKLGSFFQPTQIDVDGRVYGVAGNVHGTGSNTVLPFISVGPNPSLTPASCSGGWCDTAHHIAANNYGWDFHATGAGVIIGMIDTGIDLNQPDFAGRVLAGHCVVSSVNLCTTLNDQLGGDTTIFPGLDATHGTHTTGIAAGLHTGIAIGADILPVKVCSSTANSCAGVDEGIVWAADHGANVISVSIGGPILTSDDIAAFQHAVADGALLVVAAGNGGFKNPTGGFLAGAALQDGVRGSMIVVGATTNTGSSNGTTVTPGPDSGTLVSFSQVPSTRCEVHDTQRFCMRDYFVVAPGNKIWSTVGNGTSNATASYGYLSGTSMATPFVSGVAAVIKGQWSFLSSSDIANIIFSTAIDLGAPGVDPVYGRGAVNITAAVSFEDSSITTTSSSFHTNGATVASGPLAFAVQNSTLLKNAIVMDKWGRDFHVDFGKSTLNQGFDVAGYMMSGQFTTITPFGFQTASPIGNLVASGYAVDTNTPALLSGEFRTQDHHKYDVRNLDIAAQVAPDVELNLGFKTQMAGRFNEYDAGTSVAYDGLFMQASAVNSPYASFADGGNYVGATVSLADDLHLRVAEASLTPYKQDYEVPVYSYVQQTLGKPLQYDQRTAQASVIALNWDFASWGGLGLTATQTDEQNGLLGGLTSGAFSMANAANTTALGLSARVGFGDGWVTTVAYSEGVTQLDLKQGTLFTGADTLHSRSYGVAISKRGLFDDADSLGLAISRPVQIYAGNLDLTAATSIDKNRNLTFGHETLSLASSTPETDLELGYVTTFLDGALALQANAGYQMNVNGQNGSNSLAVLSRAKINF